ncbi:MAG: hypothetical protein EA390_10325 [Balneolaceae bacterium]|nr:MAG: hypothetical protein EA390_10325 [Balneolaceae bacterium]
MKLPSDKDIETYVKFPETLTGEKRAWIENALAASEELMLLADWFKTFYENVDSPEKEGEGYQHKPDRITMVPFISEGLHRRKRFVLAAKTTERKDSLETVQTFQSEEFRSLLRILHREKNSEFNIHLVSEFVKNDDIILFKFMDRQGFTISKPGGKISIPEDKLTAEEIRGWNSCEIYLPAMTCNLNKKTSSRDGFIAAIKDGGMETVEVTRSGADVLIQTDPESESGLPAKMVLNTEKGSSLWKIENGRAVVPGSLFRGMDVKLFFYN